MRKAGWPCLSTGTPCAETRSSSPTAPELQGPGLTSAPWDWPPGGSRAPALLWSEAAAQAPGSVCAAASPVLAALRGAGRAQTKEAGAKALLQLCQAFPRRERRPFDQGGSGCSAWPALETPGLTVQQQILDKPCLVP